jgi:hypothetical protein
MPSLVAAAPAPLMVSKNNSKPSTVVTPWMLQEESGIRISIQKHNLIEED